MTIDERLKSTQFPLPAIRQINNARHFTSISLGLGELRDFPVDPVIKEALNKSLSDDGFAYTQNAGLPALRKAIAKEQKLHDGYKYDINNIAVTIGVQNAVYACLKTLSKLGAKRVLIPAINFGIYRKIATEFNLHVETYALNADFSIDIEALSSQLEVDDVLILNSPANPTGKVFSENELIDLGSLCKQKLTQGYVVSDEIYGALVYDGEPHKSFTKFFERTLVINGISKSAAAAGLRVGWILGQNKDLMQAIVSNNTSIISTPPTPNQYAAIPVVEGQTRESIESYNTKLKQNRDLTIEKLRSRNIEVVSPRGSFYIFPNIAARISMDTQSFCINLAKQKNGVVVIPGEAFGAPGYVRISLAAMELEEGLERFLREL